MAYIGHSASGNFTTKPSKDTFSGDGSTTAFTLSEGATTNTVDVFVENVRQEPTTAYTVDGTTLTFTAAPGSGTNNIYVVNRGPLQLSATHPAAQALEASTGTFTGDLTVDTNTLVVDSTNNRVGVGTSPAQPFHVKGGAVQFENTQNSYLQINTTDTHLYTAGAHPLRFGTNSTERLRILNGGGLTFNGDTADANALDDYEEGSWTPTYVSTGGDLVVAGYSSQFGRYVKIGKMCQVNGAVQTSGITTTGTGTLRIAGLPFGIANISGGFIAGAVGYSQNFVTVNPQTVLGMPNTSQLTMRYNVGTDARSAMTGGMTTSNLSGTNNHNYIIFSITYTVTGS
jgi:hypothetical protein